MQVKFDKASTTSRRMPGSNVFRLASVATARRQRCPRMLQTYQGDMPAENEAPSGLDLWRFYEIFKRRILFFAVPFCVVLAGGVVVVAALPPVYLAEGKVLVESQQIPVDLVRPTVTTIALERIQIIEQRIKARENLLAVMEKFQLYRDRKQWLSTTDLLDLIKQKIQIRPLEFKSTGRANRVAIAFTVGFEHERAETAARVANELITMILSEDVRARTSQATETTKFLTREVSRLEGDLRGIEAKITEYKLRSVELNKSVKQLEHEKRLLDTGGTLSMANIDELHKQLAALKWELLQKSALFSDPHPNIRTLKLQIAAVEREIAGGSKTDALPAGLNKGKAAKSDKNAGGDQKPAARSAAEKVSSDLRAAVAKAGEVEMGLGTLERQQTSVQRDLEEAGRKLSSARLGESLERDQQAERFEILESPTVPQGSSKPNRLLVLALVLGAACMSGVGSVFGVEMLDKSIRSRADLNRIVDSQLIVSLPVIETRAEVRERKRRLVLAAGGALTILVGLAAAYVLMPSIGSMLRGVFSMAFR
jgi:uncharacterized protein involved in exopolysaccharide biosynthesis